MTAVNKVAIAGCGVAAMAAAIPLAKAGVQVDIFESKPGLNALGSGITLQGNALRALDQIGVWDDLRPLGAAVEGLTLRLPGPGAPVLQELPEIKTGGPDYPGSFGIYRPELAGVLLSTRSPQGRASGSARASLASRPPARGWRSSSTTSPPASTTS